MYRYTGCVCVCVCVYVYVYIYIFDMERGREGGMDSQPDR